MSLVPRSLFSRLVLVLFAGLVIAQLLSFAVHMHERSELLSQATGMQSAQRIADIVQLLDPMGPTERKSIAQVLSAPPLVLTLGQSPLAGRSGDADASVRASMFSTLVRRYLTDEREVVVEVTPADVAPRTGKGWGRRHMDDSGGWTPPMMRYAEGPGYSFVAQVRLRDGVLATFDTRMPRTTANWPYRLLLSLAVLLVAVLLVSLIAVRWATRPLKTLADAADELGKNINRPPMQETGPVEVARAARAFNTMQTRLSSYIRERTQVLAAMSHDLKTPITRLRLRAELLDDVQLRAKFTGDLQEMESMVAAALDFLRGLESSEALRQVDIMALLQSLQADLTETGGSVGIEGRSDKPYAGRPQALKRCVGNLVENAVKYGKRARILVQDNDDLLEIRIQDDGPGLSTAELEKVFEPFYRVEGSRNRDTGGTGLGLTIARSIADAHGGRLVLANRPEGGLEAMLTLPRIPGPARVHA
jgi:signal transduction histidine kinase